MLPIKSCGFSSLDPIPRQFRVMFVNVVDGNSLALNDVVMKVQFILELNPFSLVRRHQYTIKKKQKLNDKDIMVSLISGYF